MSKMAARISDFLPNSTQYFRNIIERRDEIQSMVVGFELRVEIQGRARFIRFGSRVGVGLPGVDENIL